MLKRRTINGCLGHYDHSSIYRTCDRCIKVKYIDKSYIRIPLRGKYGKEIIRELIVVLLTIDWENFTQEMDDID